MLLTDFDYPLPPELIAQSPLPDRAASRMLHVDRASGNYTDRHFRDFPALLRPDDLVVFNNTRVVPARLFGHRSGSRTQSLSPNNPAARAYLTGKVEVLLTKQLSEWEWDALVRPGRKLGAGERITFSEPASRESDDLGSAESPLSCTITARGTFGERTVRFDEVPDFFARLDRLGHVPLPPYISHADAPEDRERYQTIYAKHAGSAAAPTAGLHFTPAVLDQMRDRGIETTEVTLHVGLGTFQPLRDPVVENNRLHRERYEISPQAAEQINRAVHERRRIVAIGTTATRTLEYAALKSDTNNNALDLSPDCLSGEVDLFIYPPYRFRLVSALLTNFHLPQSSLLMLVSAFSTRELTLSAYNHAVAQHYRFFSYGDCMFLE